MSLNEIKKRENLFIIFSNRTITLPRAVLIKYIYTLKLGWKTTKNNTDKIIMTYIKVCCDFRSEC